MLFAYPAIFTYEDDGYWVSFPDVEGCYSQGDTAKEALAGAQEALSVHLEPAEDETPNFPQASDISTLTAPEGGFVSYVTVDIDLNHSSRSVKKTLTIPEWLNNKATSQNINFSQTLQEALVEKLYS